ncbi:MAG: hypothetical protein GY807_12455 [Gammaproteobacteria bacterium]|nr:hypothetical protein [Gammaproteobacteria bacterium]
MWTSRITQLSNSRGIKFAIDIGSLPISYADVLTRWENDADFRKFFIGLLVDSPFSAFRWETPPITIATVNCPFEFVLLDSPYLACSPDPSAFAEHFIATAPGRVVEFPNLGNDAIMIVPCPDDSLSDYGHLAAYLRNSSESQQHSLWELVGVTMQRRLSTKPVWLSTAGGGVAWLHVRLDDRPKYYGYAPYRHAAQPADV